MSEVPRDEDRPDSADAAETPPGSMSSAFNLSVAATGKLVESVSQATGFAAAAELSASRVFSSMNPYASITRNASAIQPQLFKAIQAQADIGLFGDAVSRFASLGPAQASIHIDLFSRVGQSAMASSTLWLKDYAGISDRPALAHIGVGDSALSVSRMMQEAVGARYLFDFADVMSPFSALQKDVSRQISSVASPLLSMAYQGQSGSGFDVLGDIRARVLGYPRFGEGLERVLRATQESTGLGRNYSGTASSMEALARIIDADIDLGDLDEPVNELLALENAHVEDVHRVSEMLGWFREMGHGLRRTRSEDVAAGLVVGICVFAFQDPDSIWVPGCVWGALASGAAATLMITQFRQKE